MKENKMAKKRNESLIEQRSHFSGVIPFGKARTFNLGLLSEDFYG